jgi:uncharacterized protein (UPF0276 family)
MGARMGISLRREWVDPLLATRPLLPALEVIFEQWAFASESELRQLERLRERHPFLLHCLSMNVGSSDPLDRGYFEQVRAFADRFAIAKISDHLSWRSIRGQWSLSLLPLPRTEEALAHVLARVAEAQSFLGRTIALENISQYLPVPGDVPLVEMFNQLHERAGTLLHLDLNNLLVTERTGSRRTSPGSMSPVTKTCRCRSTIIVGCPLLLAWICSPGSLRLPP